MAVVARNLGFAKVLFTEWRHLPPERQALIAERRDRVERLFREVLREGVASGEFVATLDVRLTAVLAFREPTGCPTGTSPAVRSAPTTWPTSLWRCCSAASGAAPSLRRKGERN